MINTQNQSTSSNNLKKTIIYPTMNTIKHFFQQTTTTYNNNNIYSLSTSSLHITTTKTHASIITPSKTFLLVQIIKNKTAEKLLNKLKKATQQ